jgi:hypothetical protein
VPNSRTSLKAILAAGAAVVAAAPLVAAPAQAAESAGRATVEVIATGLANPRDITWTPDGALLVAESGQGQAGCAVGAQCLGRTGAIARIKGGRVERVVTGLASSAPGAAPGAPVTASGPKQVEVDPRGGYTVLSNLGGTNESRAALGAGSTSLGTLFRTRDGKVLADFVDHESRLNPDGLEVHGNPYGFVRSGSDHLVVDAGGNTLVRARKDGSTTTEYVWPTARAGEETLEGVPSAIAKDCAEGTVYVADMPGARAGTSRVWKLRPGRQPEMIASGLTNLVDLEVAPDGDLLALSFTRGFQQGPPLPGYLAEIDVRSGKVTEIDTGDLLRTPTGLEVDPFGRTYVTVDSTGTEGRLVRVRH